MQPSNGGPAASQARPCQQPDAPPLQLRSSARLRGQPPSLSAGQEEAAEQQAPVSSPKPQFPGGARPRGVEVALSEAAEVFQASTVPHADEGGCEASASIWG